MTSREMTELADGDIVGHATMADGTHVPLTAAEGRAIWAAVEAHDAKRRELMPDSMAALDVLSDALTRLKDEGWAQGIYCPKDGLQFAAIQFGSTGIFEAFYSGEWPDGYIMLCDSVCRPEGLLWKSLGDLTEAESAKLARCTETERVMHEREIRAFAGFDDAMLAASQAEEGE